MTMGRIEDYQGKEGSLSREDKSFKPFKTFKPFKPFNKPFKPFKLFKPFEAFKLFHNYTMIYFSSHQDSYVENILGLISFESLQTLFS